MSMQTTNTAKTTVRSRILIGACIALLAFALAACGSSSKNSSSGSNTSAGTPNVTIANLTFEPATASVKSGATVTIKNTDDVTHTFTSDDGTSFNVTIQGGKTATVTAPTKAGTYKYHCNIHSSMHGTLTVT